MADRIVSPEDEEPVKVDYLFEQDPKNKYSRCKGCGSSRERHVDPASKWASDHAKKYLKPGQLGCPDTF